MTIIPGERVTVGLDYDKRTGMVTFKLDGRPEFIVHVGDLNRLLSATCIYAVGNRCNISTEQETT